MITFSTSVNVPADRRVTITLPPGVPVGPVEIQLSVEPMPPDPGAVDGGPTSDPKFNREWAAFYEMLPDLLKTHRGQYVAIHEGQVVGSGPDKLAVARQAREQFGPVTILVRLVSDAPEMKRITSVWHVRNVEPPG
jgi:hypothetical protein